MIKYYNGSEAEYYEDEEKNDDDDYNPSETVLVICDICEKNYTETGEPCSDCLKKITEEY